MLSTELCPPITLSVSLLMSKLFYFSRTLHQMQTCVQWEKMHRKLVLLKEIIMILIHQKPRAQTKIENINAYLQNDSSLSHILSHSAIISSSFSLYFKQITFSWVPFHVHIIISNSSHYLDKLGHFGPLMIVISQPFCVYKVTLAHHPTKHDNKCLRSYSEEAKMAINKDSNPLELDVSKA